MLRVEDVNFSKYTDGLVPVIVQDKSTLEVLMLAYMNEEALKETIKKEIAIFWSRSRNELWIKGKTSGNTMYIYDMFLDCDKDAILLLVNSNGPACHTGTKSCFGESTRIRAFLFELENIITDRLTFSNTKESYTVKLLEDGQNKICQKVGEEATETIIAALKENSARFISEFADLYYHMLLLLKVKNISLDNIANELKTRHKK